MYPYHHFHAAGCRGPSRLVWFLIGAGTATWFIKHREAHGHQFGPCRRPLIQPPPPQEPVPSSPQEYTPPRAPAPWPPRNQWTNPWEAGPTPEEKEKLAAFSRQAADTMTELTESTLDSVLNTAQALKQKLAEHRLQREKEQKELERQIEEQRRNPPRMV